MKRKISMFLLAAVLMSCLVVPVSAAEVDEASSYINVLDYATANNSGHNTFSAGGGYVATANYSIPGPYIRYVDFVVAAVGGPVTGVKLNGDALTFVQIQSRLYRVYGTLSSVSNGNMTIELTSSVASVSYCIVSFKAGLYSSMSYSETGQLAVSTDTWNGSFKSMEDSDSPATAYIEDYNTAIDFMVAENFTSYIYPTSWKKYDYLDFYIKVKSDSITSLSVNFGGAFVPFTYSIFSVSNADYSFTDTAAESLNGNFFFHEYGLDSVYVMIHVDLSNLDRTSSDNLQISLTGQYQYKNSGQFVSLLSVTGYVDLVPISSNSYLLTAILQRMDLGFSEIEDWLYDLGGDILTSWNSLLTNLPTYFNYLNASLVNQIGNFRSMVSERFVSLQEWIQQQTDTLESAIRGDPEPGETFQDEVAEKDEELKDMAAVMDSVNKPSLDSINVNVDQYVSAADVTALAAPLQVFLTGDIFGPIIIMTMILATVSYLLYGKR